MDIDPAWLAALAAVALTSMAGWILTARWLLRRIRALTSQRQSQAARHGQTMEQFAPFLADWPWDPKGFRFLGDPIDGVQFNDDGIVIVEVKTGASRLNPRQGLVRRQVEAGRVTWREVRFR